MSSPKLIQIAIDGPAGAGKSTVARMVSQKIGYTYLDTGSMYRAITLAILNAKVFIDNDAALESFLKNCNIAVKTDHTGTNQIFLNDKNVTKEIRTEKVNNAVSDVANKFVIRKMLVEKQRTIASSGGIVLDGRDIGTIVLPNAELKIFLTASLAVRAERRYLELKDSENPIALPELIESIATRDKKDADNEYGPMRAASDAITIDTDKLTIDQVLERIVALAKDRINL